ncbi:MAG: putative lipid II flippase FtsW [Deltaproteobacteria bacterium]|nr:putative lipid II flippase FtsW [Deltaproteobacteria bacterium]
MSFGGVLSRRSAVSFGVRSDGYAVGRVDSWILITTYLLLGVGVLMVFSTTAVSSAELYGESTVYLRKHLLHLIVGLGALYTATKIPSDLLGKVSGYLLIGLIFLLVLVLFPAIGRSAGGARRWLELGPLSVQPGELAKLGVVLYFSSYVERRKFQLSSFCRGVVMPLVVASVLVFLLLLEPDFGTAAVIMAIVVCQLLVAGVRIAHLLGLGLFAAAAIATLIFVSPYRMRRFSTFIDPFSDATNAGYQLIQSLIAVGSGGLYGAGLGAGKQKLFYLPAAHTDFIFAVIAEELGLIGALAVVLLFMVFAYRGYILSKRLSFSPYLSTLAVGLTLLVVMPAILNIAVVLGLLPTKGMVLPLVGYGGSAMVMYLFAIGMLLRLSKHSELNIDVRSSRSEF